MKKLFLAFLWIFTAALAVGIFKMSQAQALENALNRLGADYLYTTENDYGLKERLSGETKISTTKGEYVVSGKSVVDRIFGKLTTVVFKSVEIDGELVEPRKMVDALRKIPDAEVVVFMGVTMLDETFEDIGRYAPKLKQLGLKDCKVSPQALAKLKSERNDVELVVVP